MYCLVESGKLPSVYLFVILEVKIENRSRRGEEREELNEEEKEEGSTNDEPHSSREKAVGCIEENGKLVIEDWRHLEVFRRGFHAKDEQSIEVNVARLSDLQPPPGLH